LTRQPAKTNIGDELSALYAIAVKALSISGIAPNIGVLSLKNLLGMAI